MFEPDDGETNAVVAYALVNFKFVRNGAFDGEMHVRAVFFNRFDFADGFYYSGEHFECGEEVTLFQKVSLLF